jgi:outer membrane lipoprotein SlyB
MNTPNTPSVKGNNYHPMMILAALAVILFCLAGIAAIMGWIPSSVGSNAANRPLTEAERMALASGIEQQGTPRSLPAAPPAQSLAAAQPEPLPAPRPVQRAPAPKPVQVAAAEPASKWCSNCGNVESIRQISHRAEGSGLGAAGGAVLGGLLGNQVGGGTGRTLATAAGAIGGAVVGNQVEGNMKATHTYEIRVRLDDGSQRTFNQSAAPSWSTGDRVKIVKGRLRPA